MFFLVRVHLPFLSLSVVKVAYLPGSQSESSKNLNGPIREQDRLICIFKMAAVFLSAVIGLWGNDVTQKVTQR